MKRVHKNVVWWSALAGVVLCGCGDGSSPKPSPVRVTSEGTLKVTKDRKSAHYDTVAEHLDLGGVLYGYVDVAGDLDELLGNADGMIKQFAQSAGQEFPAEVDLKQAIGALGMNAVTAAGVSSVKKGEHSYHNKVFIHTPNGRQGLLKILGGDPGEFASLALAPQECDVVVEQEFQLGALREVIAQALAALKKPDGNALAQEFFGQEIPPISVTAGELLERSNGRYLLLATMRDEKIPLPEGAGEMPAVDLLLGLDGMGWLFEKLQPMIPQGGELPLTKEEGTDYVKYSLNLPPEGPFTFYQPVLFYNKTTGRLLLASRQSYLDQCTTPSEPKLTSSEAFKTAVDDLPKQGNAFSYFSPKVFDGIKEVATTVLEQSAGGQEQAFALPLLEMMFSGFKAQASVTVNKPFGVYAVSNASQSMKASLASMVMLNPVILASAGFSSAIPAIVRQRTQASQAMANDFDFSEQVAEAEAETPLMGPEGLTPILNALTLFAVDHEGSYPDMLMALTPDYLDDPSQLRWLHEDGEARALVYFSGLKRGDGKVLMVSTAEQDSSGRRVVGFADGTVGAVSESEFLKLARETIQKTSGAAEVPEEDPLR